MKEPEDETLVASLTIFGLPQMEDHLRERLALWLRDKSREVQSEAPDTFGKKYTSKLNK